MTPEALQEQFRPRQPNVEIRVKIQDGRFGLLVRGTPPHLNSRHVHEEYMRVHELLLTEGFESDPDMARVLLDPQEPGALHMREAADDERAAVTSKN